MVARELAAQLLHEAGLVRAEGDARKSEDQVGDVVGTILRDGEQQQRQIATGVVVETAEQTEVDERQPPVGRQEHVAAMWVGVVHALHRHLVYVRAEELPRELVCPLRSEPVVGVDLSTVDPLEHEHLFRHVRPDHGGHDELLVLGQEAGDELRVVRLLDEVELRPQVHLELVGERAGLQQLRALGALLEQLRRRAHEREVEVDLLLDSRPPHLHDHLAPAGQQRRVDLRNRRSRQRFGVDAHERVRRQFLRDHLVDLLERDRRDLVDQLGQLLDVRIRQQVRARREQLPQLDVGGAKLLERLPELPRAFAGRRVAAPHAELAQHAQQAASPRHPPDVDGTLEALGARAHQAAYLPRVRPGNAWASRADARENRRRLRDERATRARRARRRAARRESNAESSRDARRADRRPHER